MLKNRKEGHLLSIKLWVWVLCIIGIMSYNEMIAQNQYRLSANLTGLDTINKIACYDIEIANLGPNDWALGGLNINILYDGSAARFIPGSDEIINNQNMDYALGPTQSNLIDAPQLGDISYNMTLGYLRLSITSNLVSSGLTIPADSSRVPFFHLCFDILFDDITDPNTCFQMNFLNETLRNTRIFPADIVQELNFNGPGIDVIPEINQNLVPDRSFDACFVVEEDTEDLCTDGIDNDEDGLTDCLDQGCSTFCAEDSDITCNDGIDNDNDGMIDCDDDSCLTRAGSFTSKEPDNCPDLNNGQFVFSYNSDLIELSLDGGMTYMEDTIISDLAAGTYVIYYRNKLTLCEQESFFSPFVLDNALVCSESSPEECSDGLDNDGDGMVDCEDSSCSALEVCNLSESTTLACQDGIDNDNDGLADCQDSDCRFFDFCSLPSSDLIYMPSVFLLNSSNENGRIRPSVKDEELIQIIRYVIFDRYGEMMFSVQNVPSNDAILSWDGTFNNRKVASGVYVYLIEVEKDGLVQTYTGDFTALN